MGMAQDPVPDLYSHFLKLLCAKTSIAKNDKSVNFLCDIFIIFSAHLPIADFTAHCIHSQQQIGITADSHYLEVQGTLINTL